MKYVKEYVKEGQIIDGVAEEDDMIDIRIQNDIGSGGVKLYVDVNGITVLRIGRIKQQIEVQDDSGRTPWFEPTVLERSQKNILLVSWMLALCAQTIYQMVTAVVMSSIFEKAQQKRSRTVVLD
jgi:hypothetical protein